MNRVLVILGATAVGKTDLSLRVANMCNGVILSTDSRLFYRGMDIGTAKPTIQERGNITHHFIDICEPDETVTLGRYQREAYKMIDVVLGEDKLPILVGGTGQYVQAVVEGWGIPAVSPNPELREKLGKLSAGELHERLREVDENSAESIHPNNVRRVIRALEIAIVSGRPKSELEKKTPPPYRFQMIGLTCARERLYERIDQRVDLMMEAGLLDELKMLRDKGYGRQLPSMSGLGYQQLWAHLDGECTLDEAVERIKFETHRFVRHQNNWFQRHPDIVWFDIFDSAYPDNVLEIINGG